MQPDNMPSNTNSRALSYDAGLRSFFQRIYNNMALGLVFTGLVAYFVASSPALMQLFYGNALMRFIVMFSPMAFIFFGFTPARIQRLSSAQLATTFYAFSATFGISFATIFMLYSGESIARVFFITAGMFAATSGYGYLTKRNLVGMGGLFAMGAFGLLIAMVVNIFLHSAAIQFAVSVVGVIVYTGLVAFDTQMMKEIYNGNASLEDTNKTAIMGALSMYINFIMMFQFLLNLMGSRR